MQASWVLRLQCWLTRRLGLQLRPPRRRAAQSVHSLRLSAQSSRHVALLVSCQGLAPSIRRALRSERRAIMIIESGAIIFAGLVLLFIKLPHIWRLRLLGRPLALDIAVSVLAYVLHWGTFSGVMAAAVAGLMCSGF